MIATELSGGYGNLVTLENGRVRKQFKENPFTKTTLEIRQKREALNLRYFSNLDIAPYLLGSEGDVLWIEYLRGVNYLDLLKDGTEVLYSAGNLLRKIHQPVVRPVSYLKRSFETKAADSLKHASLLLKQLDMQIDLSGDWTDVFARGTTRIHGDYWLANIIGDGTQGKVIDWEFGRIGTPYQDFAAMDLWTFREYGKADAFWEGYGSRPDQTVIEQYVKFECVDYLRDITIEDYDQEEVNGFYHQKVDVLRSL